MEVDIGRWFYLVSVKVISFDNFREMFNKFKVFSNVIVDEIVNRWEDVLFGWNYDFNDFLFEDGCWIIWKFLMKEMDELW